MEVDRRLTNPTLSGGEKFLFANFWRCDMVEKFLVEDQIIRFAYGGSLAPVLVRGKWQNITGRKP